jgi:hypothetical protein
MDLTKVEVSAFPRQIETPSDCLMTALTGRFGQSGALAYGPGEEFGWRPYSFSRLTCHSDSDWLNRQPVPGSLDGIGHTPVDSTKFEPDSVLLSMLGAFPLSVGSTSRFGRIHAPDVPRTAFFRSTATSVDSAGWTEVVIQEGSSIPSNFINWPQGRGKRQHQRCAGAPPSGVVGSEERQNFG